MVHRVEQRDGGDGRGGQGQVDAEEHPQVIGAVQLGGFLQRVRNLAEEVAHNDQVEGVDHAGQDVHPEVVQKAQGLVQQEAGDQAAGEPHGEHNDGREGLARGIVLLGQGVGQEGGHRNVQRGADEGAHDGGHVGIDDVGAGGENELVPRPVKGGGDQPQRVQRPLDLRRHGAPHHKQHRVEHHRAQKHHDDVVDDQEDLFSPGQCAVHPSSSLLRTGPGRPASCWPCWRTRSSPAPARTSPGPPQRSRRTSTAECRCGTRRFQTRRTPRTPRGCRG